MALIFQTTAGEAIQAARAALPTYELAAERANCRAYISILLGRKPTEPVWIMLPDWIMRGFDEAGKPLPQRKTDS